MIVDKAKMVTDVQGVEVALLKSRDAQAFRSLIERLQQPITGYLHRLVGDRDVSQDLAQDTFLQVYKEIGKTSSDLVLDAWIYRIATNYGLQYLKRKRIIQFISFSLGNPSVEGAYSTRNEDENFLHLPATGPSVEDQTETRILIQQALSLLKPKDAACLQLHYGDGFTYEHISKIVNISPEAVRKRVTRAVEKFRAVYGRVPSEPLPSWRTAHSSYERQETVSDMVGHVQQGVGDTLSQSVEMTGQRAYRASRWQRHDASR